jgi:hypothetical protein
MHLRKQIAWFLLAVFAVFGTLLSGSSANAKLAGSVEAVTDGPQPPPPSPPPQPFL